MHLYLVWLVYMVLSSFSFLMLMIGEMIGIVFYFGFLLGCYYLPLFKEWRKNVEGFKRVEVVNTVICLSPLSIMVNESFEMLVLWGWVFIFSINNFGVDRRIRALYEKKN